jgi:HAE1 family hydrophobic/amphiphilic exporter-1
VAFAEGLIGSFLGEFGLTVAGSVVISLFVALTLTPMLAARMPPPKPRPEGGLHHRLEVAFDALERGYRVVLDWSLSHRLLTTAIALGSFALAIFFGSQLGAELFPPSDSGIIFTRFQTPSGTSLEASAEVLDQNQAFFLGLPELGGMFGNLGRSSTDVALPNHGTIVATLVPREKRTRSTYDLVREARAWMAEIPGQKVRVMDPSGTFSSTEAFEVQLRGQVSLTELDRQATRLIQALERGGGFVDLDKSLKVGLPEVRVLPDRAKAAALGVDAATLAQVVQVMIGGLDIGTFKEAGSRYDIRMRLERDDRATPASIRDLYVRGTDGTLVELRNLVRLETGASPSAITRVDRQRAVTVSGNLDGIVLAEAVARAREIAGEILPEGVMLGLAGDAESMQDAARQFFLMVGLAVLVIYMVLAAQFESFVLPLSVMLALPFSMVGALGGLLLAGMTINLFSMIGIILLIKAGGMDRIEAMRNAAPVRMRPVLMTAFSMIFGVLPAAIGLGPGSETRAPMAVATAAGMFSSMLLTLLVVPVFYVGLDALPERLGHWYRSCVLRRGDEAPVRDALGSGKPV